MKFKSRKDATFKILFFGTIILTIGAFIPLLVKGDYGVFIIFNMFLTVPITVYCCWVYFGTHYVLTDKHLEYTSGPINGSVAISRIHEIAKGQTLLSGTKAAVALNGLIVKYNKYDEVYISPKTNDFFVEEILKINPEIKITGNKYRKVN